MVDLLGVGRFNYKDYCGYWAENDDENLYDYNIKHRYNDMQLNGWLDAKSAIVYQFNSWGFRSTEFNSTGGIMFLGCSHVAGIGLPEIDTFSHIVSNRLNLDLYRMGVGGGSNDAAFRIADYWIPRLKPSVVVLVQTYNWRLELLTVDRIYNINTGHSTEYTNSAYYRTFVSTEENGKLLQKKNCYAVQQLCKAHNSKFITIEADSNMFRSAESLGYARDLAHIGKKGNQYLANIITDMVESNQSNHCPRPSEENG